MLETESSTPLHTNGAEPELPPLIEEAPRGRSVLRRALLVAGALAVVALGALGAWRLFAPQNTIQTAAVVRGNIVSTVQTNGKVQAQTVASIGFRGGGRVVKVDVKEGEAVRAGQVLAELDAAALTRQRDEASVQGDIARLRLQQAGEGARPEEITTAQANLDAATARLNQLKGGGRSQDIAAAQATLDGALARLAAAQKGATKDQIAAAQAVVNEAQANYDKVKIGPTAQDRAAAQAGVREAQATLDKLNAGPTAQDLAAAQAGVDQAQANYAKLKAGAAAADIAGAQAAVREAQANLDKARAGATTEDLAAAQARVDQATANRAQTSASLSNAKEQARIRWEQAVNAQRNAEDAYRQISQDNEKRFGTNPPDSAKDAETHAQRAMEDAINAAQQAQLAYEAAKQEEIAGLQQADNRIREAQAALDKLKAGATTQDLAAAQAGVDQAQARLAKLQAGPTADDLAAAQAEVNRAQAGLDKLKARPTAQDLAAAQAGVDRAQAGLDKLKAGPTAQDLAAAQAGVDRARAQLRDLQAGPQPETIRQAQAAVDEARATLDKVKQGATADDIAAAQAQVTAAQATLDLKKQGAGATDRAILAAQVHLQEIGLASAQAALDDAYLQAPFAGTVLAVNIKEGELAGGAPVMQVADLHTLRVQADIDEIDVGRVAAGQPVTVTLDAYPGEKLPGTVEKLAVGATQKQGSTVYKATVVFTPTVAVQPRAGMAADVLITAQRQDAVLLVPNGALETIGPSQFVTLAAGGAPGGKVKVATGLANAQQTEIIDDGSLREGQRIVVR